MANSLVRMLVATSVVLCAFGSASAQNSPRLVRVKPVPVVQIDRWSGGYVGLVAGAANGHSSANNVIGCPVGAFLCAPGQYEPNGALLSATASGSKSEVAFTGGVLAGRNWHLDRFVYGVEADLSYLRLRVTNGGSASSLNLGLNNGGAPPVPVIATVGTTAEMNWLATFRGRVGYLATPDLLAYATGGLALTNQSTSYSYTDNWIFNGGAVGNSRVSSTAAGYAVGAGAEWLMAANWSMRAEYLHVGFGTQTTSATIVVVQFPLAKSPSTSSADLTADLFRAGLIYKF